MIYFYTSFHFLKKPINYDLFQKTQYWFICFWFWFRHSCSTVGGDHLLLQWNQLLFFFLEKSKFPFFFFSSGNQSFADSIGGRLRPKTYKKEKRKKLQKKWKIDMNQKESAFFIEMKSMRHKLFSNIFVRQKGKCSRTFTSHSIVFSVRFCYPIFLL
jgi:hypothetical protein